uniref:AIG1-type G domain-containing protein n=1 Tax=Sinocyclocheilus anshuiensis TaxID=1608454 RepID=A0A671KNJ0_9TELE
MNLKSSDEIRIVLIGKTGVGKTAAANTILGENKFNSELSSSSVTKECDKARRNVNQHKVAVIDTPGLFDTKEENTVIDAKIKLCISLSAPGPHVFLVVVQLGRFTAEEKNTVEQIQKIFGEQASKYTMVLFTHGDKLKRGQKSIHEFVKDSPDLLNFIKATSGRYHVFNNDTHDPNQVEQLFEKMHKMISENRGHFYTNEMLEKAEITIQEEKQRILMENEEQRSKELEDLKIKYEAEALNQAITELWERKEREAREKAERNNTFLKIITEFLFTTLEKFIMRKLGQNQ